MNDLIESLNQDGSDNFKNLSIEQRGLLGEN